MRQIPIGVFRRMSRGELQENSPFVITSDGEAIGVFASKEDAIIIADLHPRVRKNFLAMEAKVRIGMPKPESVIEE